MKKIFEVEFLRDFEKKLNLCFENWSKNFPNVLYAQNFGESKAFIAF